jgi:hypothetical protein
MKMIPAMLATLAIMLTACSELQTYTGISPATVFPGECNVNQLMSELHRTRSMNKEKLQQTLSTWEQEFLVNPSDNHRLRLALLYVAGAQSVRNTGRAQELLAEGIDTLRNPDDRELADIVLQLLDEQIAANRKINDLNKQIADQSNRIAQLEQQQRELMSIEKKIQQRDNPAGVGNEQ